MNNKKIFYTVLSFALILVIGIGTITALHLTDKKATSINTTNQTTGTTSSAVENKDILFVSEVSPNWSLDPTDITALINEKNNEKIIVKAIVKSIEKADFLINGSGVPVTPYKVDITKVYKGNIEEKSITVCLNGGDVLIKDVINGIPESSAKKMGLDSLSEEDKNNKYISYKMADSDANLSVGEEYVFILTKQDGFYLSSCGGYGVFEGNTNSDELSDYKNIISGKNFDAKIN
ncbi:MAG: hypothetical protein K5917_05310 [Clostridiales bacterium]|nr:hypothetical protein [Clostridiales bacterium]